MFHAALGTMDYFQHLGRALAAQSLGPVIGIAGADTERHLTLEPAELIGRVAEAGHRRFQLVGYCLGGLLATEVARRLLERGLDVRDLTLVDSIPMFIDTDEELAFEAIFVANLNLDPVAAVFGADIDPADVYRAIETLTADGNQRIPAGVGHLAVPFWEKVRLGDFRLIDVPGNHFRVVEPPHVTVVTDHLAAALGGTR